MSRRRRAPLLLAAALLGAGPASARTSSRAAAVEQLCPRIRFVGPAIDLDDVEKRLVCGDPSRPAWSRIPLNQAEQFMRAFLQRRGRNFPTFKAVDDTLEVRIGTPTYVTKMTTTGLEGILDMSKRRHIVGELMTPAELDKFTSAVKFELQSRGYACPKISVTGDARTGEVHASVDPGPRYTMSDIATPPPPGIDPDIFRRYWAFEPSQPFDTRLLSLTSDRIQTDALFLSAYYEVACTTTGLHITQRVVEAPPREVRIGVGADTEGYLRGRAEWKHSRIGYRASSIDVTAFDSFLEQSVDGNMKYYLRPSDRIYLMPRVFLRRESYTPYEAAHSEAAILPSWTWDGTDLHVETRGGPGIEYFNTLRGEGPIDDKFLSFDTQAKVMSHLYEYYERDPREGWTASFQSKSRVSGAYSDLTAHMMRVDEEDLWNLGRYSPPLAVLAIRGFAGTTWLSDPSLAFTKLPPSMRFFMGGDANFRGAPLMELPNDAGGFLTAVYQGVELRAGDLLPYGLQPLVFMDGAMGGESAFHLDPAVYWAPGAGLRWALPFGSMRATIARGLTWARGQQTLPTLNLPRWQFFFTFGQEF